jgi:predicted phosphohydrolase
MIFGFDLISDLNLTANTEFDWTGKPTSLFCVISGNVTDNMSVLQKTLRHLSTLYHGVFYIDGTLENDDSYSRELRVKEIYHICSAQKNVIYLHNNVVVVDGVALVGINGWHDERLDRNINDEFHIKCLKFEDLGYLEKTLEKLQLHNDVRKIVFISGCVPLKQLYFHEYNDKTDDIFPGQVLHRDTEHKISKWVYGAHNKIVDTTIDGINYVNNAKYDREPYYPKRIEVVV